MSESGSSRAAHTIKLAPFQLTEIPDAAKQHSHLADYLALPGLLGTALRQKDSAFHQAPITSIIAESLNHKSKSILVEV